MAVSIDLANASATRAFEVSTTTLAGRATHAVEAASGGLPDEIYTRIARTPEIGPAAPVVEGWGLAAPEERPTTLRVLGVDPFSERPFRPELAAVSGAAGGSPTLLVTRPGTGFLTPETAADLGLDVGERFRLRVAGVDHDVELLGLLEPEGARSREALAGLLVMDIASAQEVLGRVGRIDRIDLILETGAEGDAGGSTALDRLRALLPPDAEVRATGARAGTFDEMTRAFRLNLTALSLLALVCGAFLIYNTMTFSVVQRRGLVGTLRAMGVTRRELFAALLVEAMVLGAAGSALGLAIGVGLGRLLVDLVTRTERTK